MDRQEDADDAIADAAGSPRGQQAKRIRRGALGQQVGKITSRSEFRGLMCHVAPWLLDR